MADIFVSYTSSDSAWAHWLAHDLKQLGHTPRVHEWEIGGGDDIAKWMMDRHQSADHVLCVVSPEYFQAAYSQLEHNAALWRAVSERSSFLLYVVVKPCRMPSLTDHRRRCDISGLPEAQARAAFRAYMKQPSAPDFVAFPGHAATISNISIRVPQHFMGRDDAMQQIEDAMARYHGRVAVTALNGMRGVGKTVLAAAFAAKHRTEYRAIWWVNAERAETMWSDLAGLGPRLGWIGKDAKQPEAIEATLAGLRDQGDGVLLILDNAPDADAIRPLLPAGGACQVLITSNSHVWGDEAHPIEIQIWPTAIGADYLCARRNGEDRATAEALSVALGGLPLAHEMAAAYCEEYSTSLAQYLKEFEAAPAAILDEARTAPQRFHDRLTVTKAFHLAIARAVAEHEAAEKLIVALSMLPPEPTPLVVFEAGAEQLAEGLGGLIAGAELRRAVAALRRVALIEQESVPDEQTPAIVTPCLRLHRLVREVARARRDAAGQEALRAGLIRAVASVYPGKANRDPPLWPRARRLDAAAMALLATDPPAGAEDAGSWLLDQLAAWHYFVLGNAARSLLERALALDETRLGPEHANTLASMNNLAECLRTLGDAAAALPLHRRAFETRERLLGPEHPDTLISVNNLAACVKDVEGSAAALPLFRRALAASERLLGPEHPNTLTSVNNLAVCVEQVEGSAVALPLHRRAFETRERRLGPAHPSTLISAGNLADTYLRLGDTHAALPLARRAAEGFAALYGAAHPHTRTARANLAAVERAQGGGAGAV